MNKQIFIINGSGGVGKDTFVKLVSEEVNSIYRTFNTVINFSSVDKVKEMARIAGWDGSKTERDRKFLSDLKLLLTEYNDAPFKNMRERVRFFLSSDCKAKLLFLHIREPEEIDKASSAFHAKTILITRNTAIHIASNMADKNVYNFDYDIKIENDGSIEDLRHMAIRFINNIGGVGD